MSSAALLSLTDLVNVLEEDLRMADKSGWRWRRFRHDSSARCPNGPRRKLKVELQESTEILCNSDSFWLMSRGMLAVESRLGRVLNEFQEWARETLLNGHEEEDSKCKSYLLKKWGSGNSWSEQRSWALEEDAVPSFVVRGGVEKAKGDWAVGGRRLGKLCFYRTFNGLI